MPHFWKAPRSGLPKKLEFDQNQSRIALKIARKYPEREPIAKITTQKSDSFTASRFCGLFGQALRIA